MIIFERTVDVFSRDAGLQTDGDGGESVVDVVRADELRVDGLPFIVSGFPAESEEGGTFDDLAFNMKIVT